MSPRTRISPSSASRISTPGIGGPTVPSRICSGGHERGDRGRLGHPPHLADRNPDRGEELEHLEWARRGADHVPLGSDRARACARIFENTARRPLARVRQVRGTVSPLLGVHLAQPELDRLLRGRRCSSGSASIPASSAALSFSHTRGTAPKNVGWASATWANTCVTSGQQVTVWPHTIWRVVAEAAVGDVGVGQERDDRAAGRGMPDRVDPAALRHLVGVGQLHPLRRSGRPRGVDQRQQVARLAPPASGIEVEVRAGFSAASRSARLRASSAARVEHDQVLDDLRVLDRLLRPVEERRLDHHHAAAGVGEQVGDLLGRGGVVDRERDRAEVDRRRVERWNSGRLVSIKPDRVAAACTPSA